MVALTNANQAVTRFEYCGCGSPSAITNWIGSRPRVTRFGYDLRGRLESSTYADGYEVTRSYGDNGALQTTTDNRGTALQFEYDSIGLNLPVRKVTLHAADLADHVLIERTFDEYGLATQEVDEHEVSMNMEYDFLGRITRREALSPTLPPEQLASPERWVYDHRGLAQYYDAAGKTNFFVRDNAGRVLCQTNGNGERLQFTYKPDSQISTLTDDKGQVTRWEYDDYGRLTSKLDANNVEMSHYTYDANDRVATRVQAGSITTIFGYDPVGNLRTVDYPGATQDLTYTYDDLNRLESMSSPFGYTSFTWTDGDQLATEDGPWASDTVTYGMDRRLRGTLTLSQPTGGSWVQSYVYDGHRRLTQATSPAGTFTYGSFSYDLPQEISYPGATGHRDYDSFGRIKMLQLISYQGNGFSEQFDYSYNQNLQRSRVIFDQFTTAEKRMDYTYDAIGQLKTGFGYEANGTERLHEKFAYNYDGAGNLSSRDRNGFVQTFGVNNLNQLTTITRSGSLTVAGSVPNATPSLSSVTVSGTGLASGAAQVYADKTWARGGAVLANGQNSYTASATDSSGHTVNSTFSYNLPASVSFSYDTRGNLTGDGLRTFEYDYENQLTAVYLPNGWRSEFQYDGLGRRRITREYTWSGGSWSLTNEVRYVYDGRLVLQERDANNNPKVTYTRGNDLSGDLQEAGGIGGLLARSEGGRHAFYHCDAQGNVTRLFDSNGQTVARYQYDPFGSIMAMTGPLALANTYRFSSKEFHQNSGLSYYGFRFYDAGLQRWVNKDPAQERGGINLFRFSRNNSLKYFDPDGRCPAFSPGIANIFSGLRPEQQLRASKESAPAAIGIAAVGLAAVLAPPLLAVPLGSLPATATLGEALQLPFVWVGVGTVVGVEGGLAWWATHPEVTPIALTGTKMAAEKLFGTKDLSPPPMTGNPLELVLWGFDDLPDILEEGGCE